MNRVQEGQSTNTVGIYPHASVHVIAKCALKAEVDKEGKHVQRLTGIAVVVSVLTTGLIPLRYQRVMAITYHWTILSFQWTSQGWPTI